MNSTVAPWPATRVAAAPPPAQSGGSFLLAVPADARARLARGWLGLGLVALIGSGLFSILLVLSRTPGVNRLLPVADLFHVALVVHVDLSVLVWFAAFAAMLWTLSASRSGMLIGWLGLGLCSAGTLLIALAPFIGTGTPIMSNYIPVLDGPVFLWGLAVFGVGLAIEALRGLITSQATARILDGPTSLRLGLVAAGVSTAVALFAFLWSWLALPASLAG